MYMSSGPALLNQPKDIFPSSFPSFLSGLVPVTRCSLLTRRKIERVPVMIWRQKQSVSLHETNDATQSGDFVFPGKCFRLLWLFSNVEEISPIFVRLLLLCSLLSQLLLWWFSVMRTADNQHLWNVFFFFFLLARQKLLIFLLTIAITVPYLASRGCCVNVKGTNLSITILWMPKMILKQQFSV